MLGYFRYVALAWALAGGGACAATVTVAVTDGQGRPTSDAVVALEPTAGTSLSSRIADKAVIAQRDETFLPLVVIVKRGGSVVFTNNDSTKHQVYSFAPIKQFAFEIDQGQVSQPVFFPQSGVAAIGCNIHDQMIAYAYVTDAPLAAISDAKGIVQFNDVPAGAYRAMLWHPRLPPGRPWPQNDLKVEGTAAVLSFTVSLLPPMGMKNMHMDY
jgi:plastocyanin